MLNGINNNSEKYVAVKYGRDDDIVAGEDGFKKFYDEYQNELDEIVIDKNVLLLKYHRSNRNTLRQTRAH